MEWADVPSWAWITFYLIGSAISGPLLVKFARWNKRKTRDEYPGGVWLFFGLIGSWLVFIAVVLMILLVCLALLFQGITRYLDKLAKLIP